jgi:hypothetical protein
MGKRSTLSSDPPTAGAPCFPFDDRRAAAQAIPRYAERYWHLISPQERMLERRIECTIGPHRALGYLDREAFLDIAEWAKTRNRSRWDANDELRVRTASAAAFAAEEDDAAISALCRLRGIGRPTATALLHWMRPDRFPALEARVVHALGEAVPAGADEIGHYGRIARRMRTIARKHGVDMRTLERALWAWHTQREMPGAHGSAL